MAVLDYFQEQNSGPQIRAWLMILYDSGMRLADRVKAYEGLSTIDPVNYPKTPRVTLIYSLTKGKLAKSAETIAITKQARATTQLQQETNVRYRQDLEDVLYAPEEDPGVREQAYNELSGIFPKEFPVKDSVSIKKSIFAGDIATTSRVLHPEYVSPQEQKKLDIQKAKEEKILAKEQGKKLTDKLKTIQDQLSTFKNIQEKMGITDTSLQSSALDLAEKRIDLETKLNNLDRNSPTYRQDTEYLDKHLTVLTQREDISNQRREAIGRRLPEIAAAQSHAEAQGRYLRGEPEPDIDDDYTVYTWNKDGTLSGITAEKRPSIDQKKAREAGEFPYVSRKQFSEQRIFNKETGALTTLPFVEGDFGLGDPFSRE